MTPLNSIMNLSNILIDKANAESNNHDLDLLKCIHNSANILLLTNRTFQELKKIKAG